MYTVVDDTLRVYSLSDLTSPSATYPLHTDCNSALIIEKRLYLCGCYLDGWYHLHIFEMNPSLTEPLTPFTKIPTESPVYKILRVGDDLLMG
jgi:hypothetical protein